MTLPESATRSALAASILTCLALEPGADVEVVTLASWLRLRGHPNVRPAALRNAIHELCRADLLYAVSSGATRQGARGLGRVGLSARSVAMLGSRAAAALRDHVHHALAQE